MGEARGMTGSEFKRFIEDLRGVMKPRFDKQAAEWAEHGPAATAAFEATGAKLDSLGGNCPVQGYGSVDGKRFYFRARGDEWQFHVADTDDQIFDAPCFYHEEGYGCGFDAGWMPKHEALGFITQMIAAFRATDQDKSA